MSFEAKCLKRGKTQSGQNKKEKGRKMKDNEGTEVETGKINAKRNLEDKKECVRRKIGSSWSGGGGGWKYHFRTPVLNLI
jgi:hypothetical protein